MADGGALESQPTTWRREDDPQYADDPEFKRFTEQLSDKLFTLTTNISRLSNEIAKIGTKSETNRVKERAQNLLEETSTGFKDVGEGLKKVQAWPDLGPSQKFTQSKLNREFKAHLTEFQVLQQRALDKQRASAGAARTALESENDEQGQQLLQEQQLRLADQSEVDFQESLIAEREAQIAGVEQSVGELNELFRDVAVMITEQGETIDVIDDNVTMTRDNTKGADVNLRTASRHQKSARNKACCLLMILGIVLLVVVLAVLLG